MAEHRVRLRYCHHCGHQVDTYTVQRGPLSEVRCSACGYPIDVKTKSVEETADCIGIVEPNPQVLTFLSKVVQGRQLARDVITAESGMDFISLFIERLSSNQPLRLAIIGTPMPHLDGPGTALALRAVEKGLRRTHPIPIVFVYPAWTEDPLRGLISLCQPALYLSRDVNPESSGLGERIAQAVAHLLGQTALQAATR